MTNGVVNGHADHPSTVGHRHYFAIGAMMNPTSVKNRSLNLELNADAVPGSLMDHKLVFFGMAGFAEVIYDKGSVMHGVVYRDVPADQMKILDDIERDYIRKSVAIDCYQPKTSSSKTTNNNNGNGECPLEVTRLENVSVYCRPQEDIERSRSMDQPPSERYVQVLSEGAQHYGVDPCYIQFLKDHKCRPRPLASEYLTFSEVDGAQEIFMTRDEVDQKGTGLDGNSLYAISRGRVIELLPGPDTAAIQHNYASNFQHHGRDVELFMARIQYDPQFGIPTCMEEVTPEHAAYTEHAFCEYFKGCNVLDKWRVIARIQD